MFEKKTKDRKDLPDLRVNYDANFFNGRTFNAVYGNASEGAWNTHLTVEKARLDNNDRLDIIAANLAKLVETQQALLETQQAILDELRGGEAPARRPARSFVPAGTGPCL